MHIERPASKQPMPPEAKRVFKGEIFDVYQWEQKLFDGSTATFEKVKRMDTVVVIPITADKQFIVLEQEQPTQGSFLCFHGGRIEANEDPATSAARELLEETGYATKKELMLWYATQPVGKIDWAIYIFVAQGCVPTTEQKLDPGERIAVNLWSFERVLETFAHSDDFHDELTARFLKAKFDPKEMTKMKQTFGIA